MPTKTLKKNNTQDNPKIKETDLKEAIRGNFNFSGEIYIKPITELYYRVNWFLNGKIDKSRFVKVEQTIDGIIITDKTKSGCY